MSDDDLLTVAIAGALEVAALAFVFLTPTERELQAEEMRRRREEFWHERATFPD